VCSACKVYTAAEALLCFVMLFNAMGGQLAFTNFLISLISPEAACCYALPLLLIRLQEGG